MLAASFQKCRRILRNPRPFSRVLARSGPRSHSDVCSPNGCGRCALYVRICCYHYSSRFRKEQVMRYLVSCFALTAASVLALSAFAQPAEKDAKKGDNKRAEMREKMLKEFDANKDGKLDDAERAKAKEKMREMRGARGGGKSGKGKDKGGPAGARGPEARRGPHPPNPAEMFAKFDKDKDG